MMKLSDYPCLLTREPVTATLMTNIIALHKETAAAPPRICKCASAALIGFVALFVPVEGSGVIAAAVKG